MTQEIYQLDYADPRSVRRNPNNIRKRQDPDEDRRLVESIKRLGVLQPPGILPDTLVAWGNRRVWAAIEVGLAKIPVIRLKQPLTETEFLLLQFTENDVRADLSDPEIYLACKEMRRLNPEWTNADLSVRVQKDASMLTRIFSVDKLIPAAREAFLAGAFGFSIAYEIGKAASEQEQHQRLADRLGGASRAEMTHTARKNHKAAADAVKTSSLRIALGNGVTITVKGCDLTLSLAAELLDKASKEVEKAKSQGLNARTAERVWRDRSQKAKAGGGGG